MEEDRLSIVNRFLSEFRDMDIDIKIIIFSDFSGHLEEGFFSPKSIKHSEFHDPDSLVESLATEMERRIERKIYTKNILQKILGKKK